ncbi:site-specific integrase [Komagataeibacter sp. FNDCR2]|uniref:site-specific integrase n=1 Tax=Komagataeibacter sp. FNDCR2 TaxID=2878682 RepID=UPI001E366412|nr:site-specific integrase [Komagataeibacter sp. FNDCR2]MCE2576616.1 tyrosine-type recombinase/integrase [Komagataeibacter sp. FNDCR2]
MPPAIVVSMSSDPPPPLPRLTGGAGIPPVGGEVRGPLTPAGVAALEAATDFAQRATAPATLRAYRADWAHFQNWCDRTGFCPLPAEPRVVGAYLASLAEDFAPATIRRRLAAIGKAHRFGDLPWNPGHRDIQGPLQGVLRTQRRPVSKPVAVRRNLLGQLLATCDLTPRGRRDRALLLVGFAAALRRSELVGLHVEDITPTETGVRLHIRASKTDQTGEGAMIGLAHGQQAQTCPVRALAAWQAVARRGAGPLFRKVDANGRIREKALHPDAVRQILHRRGVMAGLPADVLTRLTPHGLRSGFITEAYLADVREEEIRRHVRHRDPRSTRGYIELLDLVIDTPAGKIGL